MELIVPKGSFTTGGGPKADLEVLRQIYTMCVSLSKVGGYPVDSLRTIYLAHRKKIRRLSVAESSKQQKEDFLFYKNFILIGTVTPVSQGK